MTHREYDEPAGPGFQTGCPGVFQITENEPPEPAWATCNECDLLITVPQAMLRPAAQREREPRVEWSF